ncbi:MAG: NAD-dependent epimerase/dehydratase family protein [Deltaproteobacteria bacterium]|nr:NAD-dependent epimerase/dehydratase family protein [Deltaproteobacteria bacterium]
MNAPASAVRPLGANLGRCLITGGAGYLGRELAKDLAARGLPVRVFDVRAPDAPIDGVEVVVGDIRDYDAVRAACEGIDTVFHTAARIVPLRIASDDQRREVETVNVGGTEHVLRAAREAGTERVVYTSSVNVVVDRSYAGADESVPYASEEGIDLYTQTKAEAERLVLAADGEELATCALRPGGIYGPGEGQHFPRIVKNALRGQVVALIDGGRALADNVYIDDLVSAHRMAAEALCDPDAANRGRAYFINDGQPQNYFYFFKPTMDQLGVPFPTRSVPSAVVDPITRIGELLHSVGGPRPALTTMELDKLRHDHFFSIEGAARDFGWRPEVPPEEGHRRCQEWVAYLATEERRMMASEDVERPAVGWQVAVLGGLGLLFALAFVPEAYAFWRRNVGPMLPRRVLQGIAAAAIAAHVGEATYAYKLAKREGMASAGRWAWQTLLFGYPSLRLLKRRVAERAGDTA